ncbi:MAG: hypothetical protein AAF170_20035, partial [Bacteroidota bacterium]
MDLLLNPESIRTGSLFLLNIALTVYLLRVPRGSGAPRWLAGFTAGTMALYVCRALDASLYPAPDSGVLWWIKLVEALVVIGGLGALLQFAYR